MTRSVQAVGTVVINRMRWMAVTWSASQAYRLTIRLIVASRHAQILVSACVCAVQMIERQLTELDRGAGHGGRPSGGIAANMVAHKGKAAPKK